MSRTGLLGWSLKERENAEEERLRRKRELEKKSKKRVSILRSYFGKEKFRKKILLDCKVCGQGTKYALTDVLSEIITNPLERIENFILVFEDKEGHKKELTFEYKFFKGRFK